MKISKENLKKIEQLDDKQAKKLAKIIKMYTDSGGQVGNGLISKALDVAKNISNKVTGCKDKKEKWDYKPKSGENHTILTKDGCQYRARYAGPGTHVLADVKELLKMYDNNISLAVKKDNFASDVDRLGLAHDIRYIISTNSDFDKDEKNEYIRKADEKFIRDCKKLPDQVNALVPTKAIQAKLLAENIKVKAGGNRNAGNEKVSKPDLELLEKVLAHMEQMGFGQSGNGGVVELAEKFRKIEQFDENNNTDYFIKYIKPRVKGMDFLDLTPHAVESLNRIADRILATTKAQLIRDHAIREKKREDEQKGDGVVNDAKDYIGNLIAKAAKAYFTRKSGKGVERPLRENPDKYHNVLKLMSGKGLV